MMLFEPPSDFVDPRSERDFEVGHWPECNGHPAPALMTADLHERRCLEFLAAFYRLNVAIGRLLQARHAGASKEEVVPLLQAVQAASVEVERLEDRYMAIGLFGEPVMDGIFYRNILIVRPEVPKIFPQTASISSHFRVPGLEEIPESELCGAPRLLRWNHGKVDL